MNRLPVLLLLCALLLQGLGSAWAAAGMAGATLQRSDAAASLPPCHRPVPTDTADTCFDEGGCRCLAACLSQPPLFPQPSFPGFLPTAAASWTDGQPASPSRGHYGPPLRPPSTIGM